MYNYRGKKTVQKLEDIIKRCEIKATNEKLETQLEGIRTLYLHLYAFPIVLLLLKIQSCK